MIPIECPNCGRMGNVPPDRLNARLVCKGCQTIFHLDNTGHMILGEPGSNDPKQTKSRAEKTASAADFDLAQTWNDTPKPVKYGVPAVLLAVIGYLSLGPGESSPGYFARAESAVRAVASNDRSKAVSHASSNSTEAAGKWFDLWRGEMEKSRIGSDVAINPALLNGNPDRDGEITLLVVLPKAEPAGPPLTITLTMKRDGSSWTIDGNKSLASAESDIAASKKKGP